MSVSRVPSRSQTFSTTNYSRTKTTVPEIVTSVGLIPTVIATAATRSSSSVVSGVAFVATTPVMTLQKLNGLLGTLSCLSWDPGSRPSWVNNPMQEESLSADVAGGGLGGAGFVLSGYWRLAWVWILGVQMVTLGIAAVVVWRLRGCWEEHTRRSRPAMLSPPHDDRGKSGPQDLSTSDFPELR